MDYIYPPALGYGTVLIAKLGHVLPARAYHIYPRFLCSGNRGHVRTGSHRFGIPRRGVAGGGGHGIALAFVSAAEAIPGGQCYSVPQRLHVLMAYGEGPHISSLCVLPAALAAAFLALRKWRPAALAAAGVLGALVVATNFYGAVALAIFYLIMVWAVWTGERTTNENALADVHAKAVLWRAAAIPALAWGLSAFWFTPSYVRITLIDLKWVSQPGTLASLMILALVVALYGLVSRRFGLGRPDREWTVFIAGAVVVFSVYVLGLFYFGWRTIGEPGRLIPELDLVLILGCVEVLRFLWARRALRVLLVLLVALAFSPAIRYLRHAWSPFPKAAPLESVYAYAVSQWVHNHLPEERVLPAGTVRFWFDVSADNAQPDGGSVQGMSNQILPVASYQILRGNRPIRDSLAAGAGHRCRGRARENIRRALPRFGGHRRRSFAALCRLSLTTGMAPSSMNPARLSRHRAARRHGSNETDWAHSRRRR